jgi:biotin carboxylase
MDKRTTVLIVGGGFGQLPAVEVARRLGWRSVVIDRNPDAVAMRVADAPHVVDIVDAEAALRVARAERIDGCLTLQSDIGVPTVGFINDALGLQGVSHEVAVTCSRKDSARSRWAQQGIAQPRFAVVRTLAEARDAAPSLGFPFVAKAADASGSRGVVKVDTPAALDRAFEAALAASRVGVVVLEAFVGGWEIGAQTFSVDGRCEIVLLHDDQVNPPPFMIPVGHSYPLTAPDVDIEPVRANVAKAVEALGIQHGPANVDLIIDDRGRAMLLEVGARIGATCLPELTTLHIGTDWVEAALRCAVGEDVRPVAQIEVPCAAMILESSADGVVTSVHVPDDVRHHPHVREVEVTARPGDPVSRLRNGTDRIGKVVTTGTTAQEASRLAAWARSRIIVEVT